MAGTVTRTEAVACDRGALSTGIVHFGVGGFHRSHQQAYTDDLLRQDFDAAKDWCYTGVGVLEWDAKMRDYLKNNDWRYPIVAREGTDVDAMDMHVQEVVTLRDMLLSFEDPAAVVRLLAAPSTKIVSLTITEYGYRVPLNEGDHKLLELANQGVLDDPELSMPESIDAACAKATVFGLILAALAARHRLGRRPFTVMSCDNLPHNGEVAKKRVISAARDAPECDDALCAWLEEEVRYPSTMVDRITPATSPQDIADLKERTGIDDAWPVMCEPYKHWVIEDDFVDGQRPAWERVGALLVPDVRPHELMKVRLLNVTHSAMCYPAILAGLTHVHEACLHSKIRAYLELVMLEEIAPTLRANPEMDKSLCDRIPSYARSVLERFENVAVKDQLDRIAMDGSEKFRVQGSGVIREGIALGLPMDAFALYVAAWAHFIRREVDAGVEVKDMGAQGVTAPFRPGGTGLPAFLDMVDIFGDLAMNLTWRQNVTRMFDTITEHGMEFALDVVLGTVSAFPDSIRSDLRLDNPARRETQLAGDEAVVTVVNPARLASLDPIMYTSEMLMGEGPSVNANAR
mmetsp:Transcript_7628/g.33637  ORF Transcript_7628/g.33637 Transcript_7628/m.33637 type:complete len:573 (+) Transcript_7628:76-1794(+)